MTTVEQDSFEKCTEGSISSRTLGPCVGIGIYDSVGRIGYMLHYSDIKMGDELNKILDIICPNFKDITKVKILIAGISDFRADIKDVKKDRNSTKKYIRQALNSRFDKKQLKFSFGHLDKTSELHLDIETGKFELELEPDSEE